MKILIITNLENECSEEDVWIAKSFIQDGNIVKLVNKYYNPILEKEFDIFIKRYSWIEDISTFSVGAQESDYETRILLQNLPRINFDGKFDNQGKKYLAKMFNSGLPVVPTIDNYLDIDKLPETSRYLIKPINGYDGFGIIEASKGEIPHFWNQNYVIQPKLSFDSEIQFYFIGSKFQFAQIFTPKKINSHINARKYSPNEEEIKIATAFAKLNGDDFNGVQRIDFLKYGNKLLLSELEDDSPYMAIESLSSIDRKSFINNFKNMTYQYYKNFNKENNDSLIK